MTAATAAPIRTVTPYHVTFPHVLRSEWIKVRTLRSTWWAMGATAALMILMSVGFAASISTVTADTTDTTATDGLYLVLGFVFAQLTVAVLGALTITGEFSTGMIRSTLAAAPTRTPALVAKTIITAVIIAVTSLVAIVVSYLVTLPILNHKNITVDIGSNGVATAVLACIGYLVLVTIMSVAIGTLMRHSAGAIFTLVGILFVLYIALGMIGTEWALDIMKFTPMQLGQAVMSSQSDPSYLTHTEAWLSMLAWAFVPYLTALAVFRKRDA